MSYVPAPGDKTASVEQPLEPRPKAVVTRQSQRDAWAAYRELLALRHDLEDDRDLVMGVYLTAFHEATLSSSDIMEMCTRMASLVLVSLDHAELLRRCGDDFDGLEDEDRAREINFAMMANLADPEDPPE